MTFYILNFMFVFLSLFLFVYFFHANLKFK